MKALGLKPRYIVREERISEIMDAINRYLENNQKIPKEWWDELNELLAEKEEHKKEEQKTFEHWKQLYVERVLKRYKYFSPLTPAFDASTPWELNIGLLRYIYQNQGPNSLSYIFDICPKDFLQSIAKGLNL